MGWGSGADNTSYSVAGELEMRVRVSDITASQRLLEEIAWTLSTYGNVKVEGESVILDTRSVIACVVHQIVETFEVKFTVSPNISRIDNVPVYIYPRYLQLNNIENLKTLLIETILELRQAILILAKLTDMGLLRNTKYIGIVINIDKDVDRYKPVSYKVMVNIGGIGYEVVVTGRRITYRITFSRFDLFKAFADVVLPEFLESRGEVRE